jgi:hypothetical protein
MGIFDLLEHAGQASGEEAVAKVAAKVIPPSLPKVRKPKPPKKGAKDQQQPPQEEQQQGISLDLTPSLLDLSLDPSHCVCCSRPLV